jgi:hypothetical protein
VIDDAACNGAGKAMLFLKFKNRASVSNESCKHCQKMQMPIHLGEPYTIEPTQKYMQQGESKLTTFVQSHLAKRILEYFEGEYVSVSAKPKLHIKNECSAHNLMSVTGCKGTVTLSCAHGTCMTVQASRLNYIQPSLCSSQVY